MGTVRLTTVRALRVRTAGGSYTVTPSAHLRGTARTYRIAPQNSAPRPGPTLELALDHRLGRRPVSLGARLKPEG